jgi:hypothetical protein
VFFHHNETVDGAAKRDAEVFRVSKSQLIDVNSRVVKWGKFNASLEKEGSVYES